MADKPILVAQPFLPELAEFVPYLERIWESRMLTNGGPLHQELEGALTRYLGVPYISLFNNGTIALMTALRALDLEGEVITTPYSFVATANAIAWNGLEPVFADIDPETCNLDVDRIAAAIGPRTAAILPVHCYGIPCDVDGIREIAERRGIPVVYDAAHAFGVVHRGQSVLKAGALSVLSFHATKVFNTFEGGAIVCHDFAMKQKIDRLKNFGFENETTVTLAGLNGKMSEISAAFGLAQLPHMEKVLARRRQIEARYRERLAGVDGIQCVAPVPPGTGNSSYFPVRVLEHYPMSRDALHESLKQAGIFARRYFYPLITEFPMYRNLPSARAEGLRHASRLACEVLCLPIYPALSDAEIDRVVDAIAEG